MKLHLRHKIVLLAALAGVAAAVWLALRARPATEGDMRRAACHVGGRVSLCLVAGRDTLELRADSVSQEGVWINRHWWWPSCDGRVLTVSRGAMPPRAASLANADSLRALVAASADSLSRLLARKDVERKELQYYLRSHAVIDGGYTRIAAYADAQAAETDSLRRMAKTLRQWCRADSTARAKGRREGSGWRIVRRHDYTVSWYGRHDSLRTVHVRPLVTTLQADGKPVVIHTARRTKPLGAYAVRNVPWGAARHSRIITVTCLSGAKSREAATLLATGRFDSSRGHDLPPLFAADGAPVFTLHGRFLGVVSGKEVAQ